MNIRAKIEYTNESIAEWEDKHLSPGLKIVFFLTWLAAVQYLIYLVIK